MRRPTNNNSLEEHRDFSGLRGAISVRARMLACGILALVGLVSTVSADDSTNPVVFRSQTFVRTKGNPNSYTATFKLRGWVVAPFTMHVVNGDPNRRERVSSATVLLNGTQVFGASDVNQSVSTLDRVVSPLVGNNTLEVTLDGTPGAEVTIAIWGTNADQVPPQVIIVTPANGSYINTATPRIDITYSKAPGFDDDKHSDTDETTLKIILDGADRTKLFTIRKGDATATIPPTLALAPGLHTLVATLYNDARNQGSATSQFTVDLTPPAIQIVQPALGAYLNTTTPSIVIQYSDNDSVNLSTLKVLVNGADLSPLFVKTNVGATATLSATNALPQGANQIVAQIQDLAGNLASASTSFNIDTTPPTISFSHPTLNSYHGSSTVEIMVQYSDDQAIDITQLKVTLDAVALAMTASPTSAATVASGVASGAHLLVATIKDLAGNVSSAQINFYVDTTIPTIHVSQPAPNALLNTHTPPVSIDYTDVGGVDLTTLKVFVNGTDATSLFSATSATASAQLTSAFALPDGPNTITAQIANLAGTVGAATSTFLVDTTAPTIGFQAPPAKTNSNAPTVTITYSDATSGVDPYSLVVTLDGANISTLVAPGAGSATGVLQLTPPLSDGTHVLSATVKDRAGNQSLPSSLSFVVDTQPPEISFAAPPDNSFINNPAPTITLQYSDGMGTGVDSSSVRVFLQQGANPATDITSYFQIGPQQATGVIPSTASLGDGTYVLSAVVRDLVGNSANIRATFVLDTVPPAATIQAPAANAILNTTQVTVTLLYQDDRSGVDTSRLVLTVDGVNQTSALTSGPTQATGTLPPLPDGVHTLQLTVFDRSGNSSGVISQTFQTDTTPPTISVSVSPAPNTAGWNNTTVTVTFACGDSTSGIASCPPLQTVTTEGANQVILGKAVDNAGNSALASVTLNIAKTPPQIAATSAPPPNSSGWNNASVTVSFACTPTTAPIAACPPAQIVSMEAAGQIISGTATDVAGNSAGASVSISVDKTPPTIKATAVPPPNASGVNTTDVTVNFSCSDATSGIAICPPPQTVTSAGANQLISGTATDNAGNTATASVTLTIVKSLPIITAVQSPPPNAAGWNNSTVTVTFTCSGGSGGIASCTSPVTVSAEGANRVVTGTAVDQAGQTATASVTVNLDLSPPAISAAVSPSPNTAGWNNSNVIVSFKCQDNLSGVASCPVGVPVTNEGITVVTSQPGLDVAGNTAITSVLVKLDKTPPTIAITSPATGTNVFASQTTVSGNVADAGSGVSNVTCNGGPALLSGSTFSCATTLSTGANSISVTAVDVAGNAASASTNVSLIPAPTVTITSPANLSMTNISPVTVRGTVDNSADTVTINGIAVFPSGGTFSAQVPLNEGVNTLTALASNAGGNQATASVTLTLDTTPPHLTIDSPADKSFTTIATVTVTGTVNDIVVGTVNDQNAQVTVNGTAAQVANRTYSVANVPLVLGPNAIQAVARDQAGNATTTTISITRVSPSQPPAPVIGQAAVADALTIVSGNNQTGTIGTQLQAPLVVVLTDPSGKPVANQPVVLKVTGNDGVLSASTTSGAAVTVNTDVNGLAQASWTLGHRSGVGVNRVEASSAVAFNVADFAAVGVPGSAAQIVVDSGDNQTGIAGQPLTFPLGVVVTDAGHNRTPGVQVTFTAVTGGGSLNGALSQVVTTDSDGRALAVFALGPTGGSNIVQANFAGDPSSGVAFTASARLAGDPSKTTISGVVVDNSNNPMPNVTIRLYQTNQGSNNNLPRQIGTSVVTDAQGHFLISNAPFGYFKLMADGTTAGGGTASYPTLEYDIVTIAGQDNTVGVPIYLPVLNTVNKLCVDATHGGTLTLPQSPGFSLTVAPGAATFPGGARQGCVSVSTVNGDKVPMAPGFGQQPRFIVTIQPVGTIFNPPAAMTLPNVDGLAPRAKTEMYSYDHDLSLFVAIGTATVSDDGSVIASDPGTGVLKAGWHCGGDPNAAGSVADCGECKICAGPAVGCVPVGDGTACGQTPQAQAFDLPVNGGANAVHVVLGDGCAGGSQCQAGSCSPSPTGFSDQVVRQGLDDALSKIFDDSDDACMEATLRQTMQANLLTNGVRIDCKPEPPGDRTCAQQTNAVSSHVTLFSTAVTEPLCYGVAATVLHELIHGPGKDPGSPNQAYHNDGKYAPAGIDCRDRPYGCQAACFSVGLGNPFACIEDPNSTGWINDSAHGCKPCRDVPFDYTDSQGVEHTSILVCPQT